MHQTIKSLFAVSLFCSATVVFSQIDTTVIPEIIDSVSVISMPEDTTFIEPQPAELPPEIDEGFHVAENWGIGLRIVNGHSTFTVPKKKLDFYIQHRFGYLNQGKSGFFGLDESNIRLGFEYGVFNNLTVGIARSSMGKMYSGYGKWAFVKQSNEHPVSVTWFSEMDISAAHPAADLDPFYPSHRYKYTHQLIITHVFGNQRLMVQVSPTLVHRNLVDSLPEPNDLALIAGALRFRINSKISLTGEYSYIVNHHMRKYLTPCAGAGIEFYTGGHVFQMVFTNAAALTESQYMGMDNGKISKGQIRFGFNIVRRF